MSIGLLTAVVFYIFTKEYPDARVKEAVREWEKEHHVKGQTRGSPRASESSPLLSNPSSHREERGLSTKYLNPGKDRMSARDWVRMPQFYMVSVDSNSNKLATSSLLPLFLSSFGESL